VRVRGVKAWERTADHLRVRLRPRFTVSSSRPVWRQAARGLAFFIVGAIVLVAGSIGVAAGKGAWDRHQQQQRWHADLASEGVAEVCPHRVDRQCAQAGANKANAEVAYIDDPYAYLWASIGTQDYKAYEQGIAGTLWTQPRFAADRDKRFRFARTVTIDGVTVTLWAYVIHHCGCPSANRSTTSTSRPTTAAVPAKQAIARASWKHDGHLYELGTFFGDNPTAKLTQTFKAIHYVTPSG
jgi:hypothetical protein